MYFSLSWAFVSLKKIAIVSFFSFYLILIVYLRSILRIILPTLFSFAIMAAYLIDLNKTKSTWVIKVNECELSHLRAFRIWLHSFKGFKGIIWFSSWNFICSVEEPFQQVCLQLLLIFWHLCLSCRLSLLLYLLSYFLHSSFPPLEFVF